jgi:hypothetical protein
MSSFLATAPAEPRKLDPLAAFLSFLLPGLGQVLQGRVGKGVLYFVCLYSLFFYGLWMGQMKNVWLPVERLPDAELPIVGKFGGMPKAMYHRPQFLGQFWIGVAAWPAILQYASAPLPPKEGEPPVPQEPHGFLGRYMQAPPEAELNALQRNADKTWDLGWVYTVIAGVLNILVIYDALAGPVIRSEHPWPGDKPKPDETEGGK